MLQETFQKEKELLEVDNYLPSVSIILPFEPKMSAKTELEYQLKRVIEKVERELMKNYVDEKARLVTDKLKNLVKTLDYSTYKRSIAIFVSPLLEKMYYLDIPVEEKIIIDESFEIRDLVYIKKRDTQIPDTGSQQRAQPHISWQYCSIHAALIYQAGKRSCL